MVGLVDLALAIWKDSADNNGHHQIWHKLVWKNAADKKGLSLACFIWKSASSYDSREVIGALAKEGLVSRSSGEARTGAGKHGQAAARAGDGSVLHGEAGDRGGRVGGDAGDAVGQVLELNYFFIFYLFLCMF